MKIFYIFLHAAMTAFILSSFCNAQDPPEVIWSNFYPVGYEEGNYTMNDIKQSPHGGFVMTGMRSMTSRVGGYGELVVIRVNAAGEEILMNQIFTGYRLDSIWDKEKQRMVPDSLPWNQEAFDMIITPTPQIAYLLTGYRDTTLGDAATPPGLFLMEVGPEGRVLFDSLYYNNNLHHIAGQCIQPAIGGGYIIACSFREDGGGTDKTMVCRLIKNKEGKYEHDDIPFYRIIPVGQSGYAKWIGQYGDGYLMGGTAFQGMDTRFDLFIQKLDNNRGLEWTRFYGGNDSDGFADALIAGDHLYIAGYKGVLVPGTTNYRDQIYVIKADVNGEVAWEKTYGGNYQHYANKIMMTGEGDLLIAGTAYNQSKHTNIILMKIDSETGDSLWTQIYASQFTDAGIRDAIRTNDFGYLAAGRGSYTSMQDPRVYLMKLDHGDEKEHLEIPREDLSIPITPSAPAIDVIKFTTNADTIHGVTVMIDTLLHPSVGDLEVSLVHDGVIVTLVDRPIHSGENFIETGFGDTHYRRIDWDFAPYTFWYKPEDELSVFKTHKPAGEWTLSVTDFGSGSRKATTRILKGWTLNLLTSPGAGTGLPPGEELKGFGLEYIAPNPADMETRIIFRLNAPGKTLLSVYNLMGQLAGIICDQSLPEGVHERIWYPGMLSPGTYFVHLECMGMVSVRKVVLR